MTAMVGDHEIALAPRILGPLGVVRVTLMYLRTNTCQEAIADVMGVSQPTISRAIAVLTRIIARVLGRLLATAEQVPGGQRAHHRWDFAAADGAGRASPADGQASTSAPGSTCRSWRAWAGVCCRPPTPLPKATHDAKAIAASDILEEISPSRCIADKGYIGTGITTPYKKPHKGRLTEAQRRANRSLNKIRRVVERTIPHIKSWKILAHNYRRPLDTLKETITATLSLYTCTNPRITFPIHLGGIHPVLR